MPAAELFATWAVAEAAASTKPFTAVIAVGDCDPAADALDAASIPISTKEGNAACARQVCRKVTTRETRDQRRISTWYQNLRVLSAHPFGLAPERLLMEAACNDRAPAAAVPPVVDEMDGELTPPIPPFLCLPTTNPPVQLTNVTRPRMTVH